MPASALVLAKSVLGALHHAPSALAPLLRYVNLTLLTWLMRKFKRFTGHKIRADRSLQRLAAVRPDLFVHWRLHMTGVFT
jgi:RNA-directed DNA polymerase